MFSELIQWGVWPTDSMAYIWLGVAILLLFANWIMRGVEFLVLKRHTKYNAEKQERYENPTDGVSVIITVNNNAELIRKNLPKFLDQDFPNYEVIVVDEVSDDESIDVLNFISSKYPNLKVSRLYAGVKFRRTKKIALNIGILGAQYDILLFSEIYAAPVSRNWIREMYSSFTDKIGAVLGASRFPNRGKVVDMLRFNHNIHTLKLMLLNHFGIVEGSDLANYAYKKSYYMACRGFSKNNQSVIGYEREMILKIMESLPVKFSYNRSNDALVEYSDNYEVMKNDEAYYFAEKKYWKWSSVLFADMAQWIRLFAYIFVLILPFVAGFPYWFVGALILLTFIVDFLCVNLQMRSMLQKKLFITSLMSTLIGYWSRWGCRIKTLVSESQWR